LGEKLGPSERLEGMPGYVTENKIKKFKTLRGKLNSKLIINNIMGQKRGKSIPDI
jgi:hypothetical protein